MSESKLEELRRIIADTDLPIAERRVAADHAVKLQLAAVAEPPEDDARVLELRTPWTETGKLEVLKNVYASGWKGRNLALGWDESGPTIREAKKRVHERYRMRAVLAVIVDKSLNDLEKIAGCQYVLDQLHPRSYYHANAFTPEKMLAAILPDNAMKWIPWRKVPVERPPKSLADVW